MKIFNKIFNMARLFIKLLSEQGSTQTKTQQTHSPINIYITNNQGETKKDN